MAVLLALAVSAWAADTACPSGSGTTPAKDEVKKAEGPQGGHGQHPMPPLIKALDPNGDMVIDATEMANAGTALKALDKDGDGTVSREEMWPGRGRGHEGKGGEGEKAEKAEKPEKPEKAENAGKGEKGEGKQGRKHHSPLLKALDTNGDGSLDATEMANAPAALKTLDKNNDGKLTAEELRPPRPEGKGGKEKPQEETPATK